MEVFRGTPVWMRAQLGVAGLAFLLIYAVAPAAQPLPQQPADSGVQTFGVGSQVVYVVQRGDTVSLFVDQVPVDVVLEHLQEVGGPTFSNRTALIRPVTVVLHDSTMEQAVRRLLKNINSSFHFREGRLAHVRLIGEVPGRTAIPPRPVETRAEWTRIETGR